MPTVAFVTCCSSHRRIMEQRVRIRRRQALRCCLSIHLMCMKDSRRYPSFPPSQVTKQVLCTLIVYTNLPSHSWHLPRSTQDGNRLPESPFHITLHILQGACARNHRSERPFKASLEVPPSYLVLGVQSAPVQLDLLPSEASLIEFADRRLSP